MGNINSAFTNIKIITQAKCYTLDPISASLSKCTTLQHTSRIPCCHSSYLLYVTGRANGLLHVLLIGLQHQPDALHQLLDLRGQALRRRLLQDVPHQLLRVSVALVVHHGRGPGPAGPPAVLDAPSQGDLAPGAGGQPGLRRLGGRVGGPRRSRSSRSVAAALHCSR